MLPQATADLYDAQTRRAEATALLMEREWRTIGDDLDAGWARVGPRLTAVLSMAQVGAARDGAAAVPATLAQSGYPSEPLGQVRAARFAGLASDGRPLSSLLYGAVVKARGAQAGSLSERLGFGSAWLRLVTQVQVSDAGRAASQVAVTATQGAGWVRYASVPCCQDCAILAGKWFAHNAGFKRHPGCDCVHRAAHEDEPSEQYAQDVPFDQIRDLTAGQRAALAEGADLNRVVNAYRREVPGRRERMTTTSELSSSRASRLTPDGILARSTSREQSIALLRQHGYLI